MHLSFSPPTRSQPKARIIGYWVITAFLTFELVHGALWDFDLLNKGYVYGILRHLGYPIYLGAILGVCKLAAAVVILLPRFLLLKEWTYAAVVILFGGAFASHSVVGDGPAQSIWSLLFAVLTVLSWYLRPADRKMATNV